jgi:phosphate transport system substrate-binding protein
MRIRIDRVIRLILVFAIAVSFTACVGAVKENANQTQAGSNSAQPNSVGITLPFSQTVRADGAGASFPAPLYQNWFTELSRTVPQLQFNFQATGSSAGIERFTNKIVDFGASDIGMTDEQIARVERGVILLPMTAGSIVLAYNVPEIKDLKLSREAYVGIFQGKITRWNDPKIAQSNPGVKLPDRNIVVVHRSDGSGTTSVFTEHLSAISPEWKQTVGSGTSVEWGRSGGTFTGERGNAGVTALIDRTQGSIGFLEYSFAAKQKLSMAALENKAGKFVVPSNESGSQTLAQVELPENLKAFITDPPGDASYPIVTYTWMMLYKKYDDPNKAVAMEAMIQYGLTEGQKRAPEIGYIQLPPNVVTKVAAAADQITPDFKITVPQP